MNEPFQLNFGPRLDQVTYLLTAKNVTKQAGSSTSDISAMFR